MPIYVTDSLHPDSWRDFVNGNPDANVFHSPDFQDIFTHSSKYVPHAFFLVEEKRVMAAVTAVQTNILGARLAGLASRAVVYGGILIDSAVTDKYLQRHIPLLMGAFNKALSKRVLYAEIRNVSKADRVIPAVINSGFKFAPHLNCLIHMEDGSEIIWSSLSQSLRKAIRQAEKRSIEILELQSPELLPAFHELVSETYAKVHIPCFEKVLFKHAWDELFPKGMLRVTLAKHEEKFIAARAALVFNGRVFDWFAGSSSAGDILRANALLAWDMIRWGCGNGLKIFDFGGAGDPNKPYGVRDFKMKFMGELVNFGRFKNIYSYPKYAAGYLAYNTLKKLLY